MDIFKEIRQHFDKAAVKQAEEVRKAVEQREECDYFYQEALKAEVK